MGFCLKRIFSTSFIFSLLISLSFIGCFETKAAAMQMPMKVKVLVLSSAYGTIGGTLMGVAGLAFKGNVRGVAKGASFGLYAGIIFGAYVVFAHEYQKYKGAEEYGSDDAYGDEEYEDEEEGEGDEGMVEYWNPNQYQEKSILNNRFENRFTIGNKKTSQVPSVYINLINFNF